MKNKKIASLVFTFIVLGVFYFVYRAVVSDSAPDISTQAIDTQVNKIEQMQNNGLADFSATNIDGKTFKFSEAKNKIVILNFWASWCGPCVQEFPSLLKLIESRKGEVGLVAVSLDTDETQMGDFLKSYDVKNPNIYLLKDPQYELAQQIGTFKLPESYIFDVNRKLVKKISGAVDWTSPEISKTLNL